MGGFFTFKLFSSLRTDFEELLPSTARSVVDLNEITSRLESIDNITVVVLSKDTRASKRFIDDLAASLEKLPKSVVSSVEYKVDHELKFFQDRMPLYMQPDDLKKIRNYVRDRIAYEKELRNPLNIFSGVDLPEPRLDISRIESSYQGRVSAYTRLPGGYYATQDETVRALLVYMPGKSYSVDHSKQFKELVENAILRLKPKSYASDMEYRFTGGVEDTLEENAALVADLVLSTVIVMALVTAAMLLFYRSFVATFALLASLFAGTLWTFGVSWFVVGYLNANSAFMGSIVIGNGINFGIIFLARYLEERRALKSSEEASRIAISATARSTLAAALAASLAYGSLMLTSFRGFSQFGVIGLIGMVLCWISSYTLLPAMLKLLDRRPLRGFAARQPRQLFAGAIARVVGRFPKLIFGLAAALTVASVLTFSRYDQDRVIESDLSRLRNKFSLEEGSDHIATVYLDKIFQRYMSPLVVLAKTREDAREIQRRFREEQKANPSMIANVQTLDDFLPDRQKEKIEMIEEIRSMLPRRLVEQLDPKTRGEVAMLLNPVASRELKQNELPPLVLRKFAERSGTIGNLVLVEPPLRKSGPNGRFLRDFVEKVRNVVDSVRPGTPVAGSLSLTYDMNHAISIEGPRATLFAFVAVTILVALLFRRAKIVALCLFALLLGSSWLAGFILGFGYKINFLNFIALPITFGIGVDYGVNIFQRYREEGDSNILGVVRNTGGAVMLASFTTIIGYSSLLIASNQGFVSFGTLAVIGELACVSAAVVALPAFLLTVASMRGKGSREKEGA